MSLLPRFYEPSFGRVLIDGIDVADFKLATLRAQIGFVLQDTILLDGTIRENIAYGRPGASDEEIVAAARIANADEFISRMPDGYGSMVGTRGEALSGGQRQRIAIAPGGDSQQPDPGAGRADRRAGCRIRSIW